MKLALCQMLVGMDKQKNTEKALSMIREAAAGGADIVSLPEMWNCPYSNKYFREYAEGPEGPTAAALSGIAKRTRSTTPPTFLTVPETLSAPTGRSTSSTST